MSRSGIPPQINASLIREARMIFKTFMAHRTTDRFNSANYGKQSTPQVISLTCSFCLKSEKRVPEPAITVTNGNAVCHLHMSVA